MFYLFDLARNGKNYGSIDAARTNNNNNNNNNNSNLNEEPPVAERRRYLPEVAIANNDHADNEVDPLFSYSDDDDDDDDYNNDDAVVLPINNTNPQQQQQPAYHHRQQILLNIDDAINRLGTGRFHYHILIASGLLMAADSIQSVLLSFLSKSQMDSLIGGDRQRGPGAAAAGGLHDPHRFLASLLMTTTITPDEGVDEYYNSGMEEVEAEDEEITDITMVVFPAAIVGALVLGMLGDWIGRRIVFCYLTAPIIATFGMGTAVVSASAALSNQWLLVTSFWVAFGIGGLTIPYDTLSEVLPFHSRGRFLIYLQMFWCCGELVVHVILNYMLLDTNLQEYETKKMALFVMVPQLHATIQEDEIAFSASWRWVLLVVICAIPCVYATILGILTVPESPRWLILRGYPDQALDVLRQAADTNRRGSNENGFTLYPLGTILYTNEDRLSWSSICNLCSPDWMKITSSLWATYFGLAFLDHGTMTLTVSVFSNDARQQDYQAVFRTTSELVGLLLCLCLVDKYGRVFTQRWSYLGGGISCVIISLLITPPTDQQNDNLLLLLAFVARMLVTTGTAGTWIATAEVLTTEIRTSRHAIADAIGRIGGFVASYVFLQITSLPFTGLVLFAVSLWTTMACGGLPETSTKEMGQAHIPLSLLARTNTRRRQKNSPKR